MRRILTLGLCALYLAFGSVAGLAHVHGPSGHHEESRGLHVDHAHLKHADDHAHEHTGDGDGGALLAHGHVDHHDGDAAEVSASAVRWHPNVRSLPAIVSVGSVIDRPSLTRKTAGEGPSHPWKPPRKIPPRLRAPPA